MIDLYFDVIYKHYSFFLVFASYALGWIIKILTQGTT